MMSRLVFVAWSRPVLSLCCTEYGPSRDAVLSDHFTTVVMSRSGQLGSRVFKAHSCVTEALVDMQVATVRPYSAALAAHRGS
jgi:hypothetical protein